ncbi:FixH family protein [Rhizobium sp. KVB221]|uniref:FixH family protein n=1 Tax=Rhizobium setariae TaxID=2801340 RepID=A0A936YS36_9HYPH|nr:FixH family protein [Rhizobium setariae]MBL0373219.1 FixH family protein [Rhizobium setariae]
MNQKAAAKGTFTGWHMFAIMIAFFGTIIAVNSLMAYYASASWSGLLAKNTYVASQDFNLKAEEAREWASRGFKGRLEVDAESVRYQLEGPAAEIDALKSVTALFHRPVGYRQDFELELKKDANGIFTAEHALASGQWIVDLASVEHGKTIYHQATRITISDTSP